MHYKYVVVFLHVFLVTSLQVLGQVSGFYMKGNKRKVEIAFNASNNLIIIPVSINGHEPVNFLLDTGVKSNLLFSKELGNYFELKYSRKLSLVGADGNTILTASVSTFNDFDLEKIEGIFQTLLVLDEEFLELESVIGVPIAGVIGYEFFKQNPVKIDYDNQKLTFFSNGYFKKKPFGYRKLPMIIENEKPYIQATIKQRQKKELGVKLLIDTGANHGLLLNPETSDDIEIPKEHLATDLGRSLGGDLYGFVARIKRLELAGMNFQQVITSYPESNEFTHVILQSGRQGSLGAEVLAKTTMILDYGNENVYVKKGEKFKLSFDFDMSGITPRMVYDKEKRFYVHSLRENSPAAFAGVKVGDEILAVNKLPKDFWELPDLIKLFRSNKGTTVYLTIKRLEKEVDLPAKEVIKEIRFELKRQI
jgi:predicted aspartyl protease